MATKEKAVEKIIMKGIRWHGAYCQKVHSGKMLKTYVPKFGPKRGQKITYCVKLADEGTPDLLNCVPVKITQEMVGKTIGVFVAVEVKKDEAEIRRWQKSKEERSQNQKAQHKIIRNAGGIVILAASLKEVLNDFKSLPLKISNEQI